MTQACYSAGCVVAGRVALVDSCTGEFNLHPHSQYVFGGIVGVTWEPQKEDGEKTTIKDMCGNICVTDKQCDQTVGYNVEITLCRPDNELVSLLTGEPALLDDSGNTIGYAQIDDSDCSPFVSLELFEKLPESQCTAGVQYRRIIFPKIRLTQGAPERQGPIRLLKLTGVAESSLGTGWGQGPAGDSPFDYADMGAGNKFYMSEVYDDTAPDPACGYTPLTCVSYHDSVLADSPTAYWPLNDLAAPGVDIVGGLDLLAIGAGPTFAAGALRANGDSVNGWASGDRLEADPDAALHPAETGPFSLEFIIDVGSTYSASGIIDLGVESSDSAIELTSGGNLKAQIGTSLAYTSTDPLDLNTIYHVAIVVNGGNGSTFQVYINGVADGAPVTYTGRAAAPGDPFSVGALSATDDFLNADVRVSDVSLYPTALSEERVQAHVAAMQCYNTDAPIVVPAFVSVDNPDDCTVCLHGTDLTGVATLEYASTIAGFYTFYNPTYFPDLVNSPSSVVVSWTDTDICVQYPYTDGDEITSVTGYDWPDNNVITTLSLDPSVEVGCIAPPEILLTSADPCTFTITGFDTDEIDSVDVVTAGPTTTSYYRATSPNFGLNPGTATIIQWTDTTIEISDTDLCGECVDSIEMFYLNDVDAEASMGSTTFDPCVEISDEALTLSDEILADTPIAYWPLDDVSAPGVDVIAARNMLAIGAPVFQAGALRSDGNSVSGWTVTDYLQANADAALHPATAFTLEAVFDIGSGAVGMLPIIDNGYASGDALVTVSGGLIHIEVGTAVVSGTTPIATNTQHHVALVSDGSNLIVYLDGVVEIASTPYTGRVAAVAAPTESGFSAGAGSSFTVDGRISDLAIYSTDLSAGRVAAHYASM